MIIRYAQLHIHSTPTLFYLFHVQPTAFSLAEYLFILSFYVSILHGLIRATIQVDTADSPSHTPSEPSSWSAAPGRLISRVIPL